MLPLTIFAQWTTVGTAGFSAGVSVYHKIAVDANGTPYVVYQDAGNSNKATVMKYKCVISNDKGAKFTLVFPQQTES